MTKPLSRGLYLITPDTRESEHLLTQVGRVMTARPAMLQYRNKLADAHQRRQQASELLRMCRAAGVPLIINDDVELACEIGADGVHLGKDDGEIARARAALGADRILGVSCYDEWVRAERGVAAGADYVAFGAMFPTTVKPNAPRASLQLVERGRRELNVPVVTIGGITLERAPDLVAAGADLVAVINDVFKATDPAARAAGYRALFESSVA